MRGKIKVHALEHTKLLSYTPHSIRHDDILPLGAVNVTDKHKVCLKALGREELGDKGTQQTL